jgi:uncharacterized radical SAM superfamily Fe-S cluster-containing enzyme
LAVAKTQAQVTGLGHNLPHLFRALGCNWLACLAVMMAVASQDISGKMTRTMHDRFGRQIDYLRVSITDRCNLHSRSCMPPEGVTPIRHEEILAYEERTSFVRTAATMGVRKVGLTGGEPLLRRDVVWLVEMLARMEGTADLTMTRSGSCVASAPPWW